MSPIIFILTIMTVLWMNILMTTRHLLSILMMVELLSLSTVAASSVLLLMSHTSNIETLMIIITLSVSEASISLAILVSLVSAWGNDKPSSLRVISM